MSWSLVSYNAPFIIAAAYTALLLYIFVRRGRQGWLLGFLAASTIWQLLRFFFRATSEFAFIPDKAFLLSTILLGLTTARFVGWPARRWGVIGIAAAAAVLLLDILVPTSLNLIPFGIRIVDTVGGIALVVVWLLLSVTMWRASWQQFQLSRFPEHANRILYWLLTLGLVFVGEGFLFFLDPILNTVGQLLRLLGVIGLTVAVSSYRLIDVRTRAQRGFALLVVVVVSSIPAAALLLLLQWLSNQMRWEYFGLVTFVVVVLTFLGYQPFRRFVERLIFRYFIGQEFDTNNVVRRYSQAISRTLDVNELSLVIVRIIRDILQTSRGALMLYNSDGELARIDPVPGMGEMDDRPVTFNLQSRFIQALRYERKPLQQYDLDFNPDFREMDEGERAWLQEQAMALFVPIHGANGLAGIIALGPKATGLIYRPAEMDLLQVLADQTVVALQNARLYSELGQQNERNRQLNIDLRKQNERLEVMDQAKADFIAIASHELRTPLTQVKGYADILDAMNEENMLTREQTRAIIGHVNRATTQLEKPGFGHVGCQSARCR